MKKTLLTCALALSVIAAYGQEKEEYKAYVVSNAHLDTQWNWDIQTTINEYIPKTIRQNLWLIENNPNYIFNFEGAVKYNWMKEYYPVEYQLVKEAIEEGRWHISGSSWDANDTNVPSPESVFRNILLGQEYYKKEFGIKSTDIFLPDCFGFSYTLPTIASHCGLIGFSTQKLTWRKHPFYGNRREPFSIGIWYGIDGSAIQCAFDCGGYVYNFPSGDLTLDKDLLTRAQRGHDNTAYRYFGAGDTGGSPSIWSAMAIEEAIASGKGPIKIISAASDQIYKDYIESGRQTELPVYDGELLMDVHATGCYTSQSAMKRFNRRNEQLADAAEKASVMADWYGALPYQKAKLNEAWQRFLWHQFHDDLTGTSLQKAYTFSWNDEIIAQSQFADVMQAATAAVIAGFDTNVKGIPVVVYNPSAYRRTSIVEASVPFAKRPSDIIVHGPDKKPVASQLLSYSDGQAKIIFAATSGAVGYSIYDVRAAGKKSKSGNLHAENNIIENSVYKVTLNERGDIASIIDKRNGKELVKKGEAVGPVVFNGNESSDWPAWEIAKATLDAKPEYISDNVNVTVVENGPLRATLKVEKKLGDSSFIQYISLTEGVSDDRIDVLMDIDWSHANSVLKLNFPWSIGNPKATYDLGLGHIERGNNTKTSYEVCAQHWADLTATDGSYGVSVIDDCKYGWDKPNDNTLRLTLFHNPYTAYRYKYQEIQDFGNHQVRYSIFGHEGDAIEAGIVKEGEEVNQPLISYVSKKHKGYLGREFSFVDISSSQIALKALKKAEDGDGYIIRVYETEGRTAENVRLSFPAEIVSAVEVNGIEEYCAKADFHGNELIVSANKFQPKTYRVHFAEPKIRLSSSESRYIQLPYNLTAISPDAFKTEGNMDNSGNSYSDELMPDTLVNNGINFIRGKAGVPNAVKCQGQTIKLPKDKDYNKLYLLVASSDRDRHGDFIVDGKKYGFDVPYYSDFYAQWSQDTFSEGYVKNGNIAYVGTHRHNAIRGNDAYVFTYLFQIVIDLGPDSNELVLPDDSHIVLFAATAAKVCDDITPAMEVRALPFTTKEIKYTERDKANLIEGADVVGMSNPRRIEQDRVPHWALDGNDKTVWKDTWNDVPDSSKYMELDLGQSKTFNSWSVTSEGQDNELAVACDMHLLVKNAAGDEWKKIDTISGNRKKVMRKTLVNIVEARYVKLEVTKGNANDNTFVSISEFGIYNE